MGAGAGAGGQVEVRYILKVPRGSPNAGKELSRGAVQRYTLGSGEVCAGLDLALASMVEGEAATARLKRAYSPDAEARECFVELLKVNLRGHAGQRAHSAPPRRAAPRVRHPTVAEQPWRALRAVRLAGGGR